MWLERPVAKAVAGSSYRCQADFDMESVRIACSLGGSCVKGPRRLPDIVNLSISNDSCHGKPTTDRSSTSHPKNSLNLQQHRRPSPFLHTTQLSGSSLPERTASSSPSRPRSNEIGPRATRLCDSLKSPIPTAKMSSTHAPMSDDQVRRCPAANSGRAGVCLSRLRDSISPHPPSQWQLSTSHPRPSQQHISPPPNP